MKRKRSAATLEASGAGPGCLDAGSLQRQLVQCATIQGLVATLSALQRAGALSCDGGFKPRQVAKGLTKAKRFHAQQDTLYGRVVQQMTIPSASTPTSEFCHPVALLCYLAKASAPLFDIMASLPTDRPLNIIIYIDELVPGSPLRHDKARTMHAIYWAIAEWPSWLLVRTGAWLMFGVIRSKIVNQFPGRVSQLMAMILRAFFASGEDTMQRGILLESPAGKSAYVKARFGGFLADEKGLKEIYDCKGASGASRIAQTMNHDKSSNA